MEARFGHDFSDVRVHGDAAAASAVRAANARAYTTGSDLFFSEGGYAPGTPTGMRLLAHELTHVVQSRMAASDAAPSATVASLEAEARRVSAAVTSGTPVGPISGRASALVGPLRQGQPPARDEEDAPNPIASWEHSAGSLLLIHSDDRLFLIPGGSIVWTPTAETQRQFANSTPHFNTDLGTLFEVPATGASGTRVFRAGRRTALLLDAGSDPGGRVPAAVYLDQLGGVMANLGLTSIERVQIIHVHRDHVSEIPQVVARFNVQARNVMILAAYIGTNADMRRAVSLLQGTTDAALVAAGFGASWQPGVVARDRGGAGDVFRYSYRVGELVVENVALRSALRNVSGNPDLSSLLTRVTRTTDQAKAIVLGDLRGRDLARIRTAMEAQRAGSWTEFFGGVTLLSGFSHHAGRLDERDVSGIMSLLDATLMRTGRLRVVEQTNPNVHREARADTLELMSRLGVEVVTSHMPTTGAAPSAAGATRDTATARGPDAAARPTVSSNLTSGLSRLDQLVRARETIETWRPWLHETGGRGAPQAVNEIVGQIDQSVATLRPALLAAAEATVRVRSGGNRTATGERDYSAAGGPRGASYARALNDIPATTPAETAIGAEGFRRVEEMRNLPASEIPLRVAIHAAVTRGEYSDKAFAHMLGSLEPSTRDSLLAGRRGGRSTQRSAQLAAFQRVRANFEFRRRVLGSQEVLVIPRTWSSGGQMAGRGVVVVLLALEVWNSVVQPMIESQQMSKRTFSGRNLLPFLRRLQFWQQARVSLKLVGVDDPTFGSPDYERRYDEVISGLQSGNWDALYAEEPGLSDADVIVFGAWLSYHIRNFDEFATLFLDSGQDAITWETPATGGWQAAQWKVRVGRYQTSGENKVEEYWYTHPTLTQLMQVYVQRIIANTKELLEQSNTGQDLPEETEARIGQLEKLWDGERMGQARLRTAASTSTVRVMTTGRGGGWGGSPPVLLPRTVNWWTPPVFWVYHVGATYAEVGGADYNTFAILRGLLTEHRVAVATQASLTDEQRTVIGNEGGRVWISRDLLDLPQAAPRTTTPPTPSGPRVRVGPLAPMPGGERDPSSERGVNPGLGIGVDF